MVCFCRKHGGEICFFKMITTYIEGWNICALIFLLSIMFVIHRSVNIIGYKMHLKKEPW